MATETFRSQSTYPLIEFLAKWFGIDLQVFDSFSFQKGGKFASAR